jgi:hypothetical protein
MTVPEVIPIAHEPGYRTDTIGRYADGQFFASATYAYREGYTHDWGPAEDHHRLYAVLHRFTFDGHHVDSDIWYAGTWGEQKELQWSTPNVAPTTRADARLAKLLDALPGREYTHIAIRPFQVEFDGVRFELIVEQHGEDEAQDNWAELYPDGLGFHDPWNGNYDT